MISVPLAHAGHWLAEAAYIIPVIAIVVWISIRALLDRRADARAGATDARAASDREPDPPA